MEIVRAVRMEDLDQLWGLIEQSTYGLTTLQITKEQLSERIELSSFAFTRKIEKATGDPYVMVMEDVLSGTLVGLSCIFSKTGGYEPFYSYRRVVERQECEYLGIQQEIEVLVLDKLHDGPTEIGSLFLRSDYRGKGRGRLLSLARFLFMAMHPRRFSERVIAEMRGVSTEQGQSLFWDAILQHFFKMQFPQADRLSTINKRFIEDLMPRHPIYTCLLSDEVRASMGEVHPNTRPALAMLEAEGFSKTNHIDIFDGGPMVSCLRDKINAVKRCKFGRVSQIVSDLDQNLMMLASKQGGFRAMLSSARLLEDGFVISEKAADALQVKVNDDLVLADLYPVLDTSEGSLS